MMTLSSSHRRLSDDDCSKSLRLNPLLLCVLLRLLLFSVTELGNPAAKATAVKTMTSYLGKETGFHSALLSILYLGENALNHHSENIWKLSGVKNQSQSQSSHHLHLPFIADKMKTWPNYLPASHLLLPS